MIFFSDLDKTIIHSRNSINDVNNALAIEKYLSEHISFVSSEIILSLQKLSKKMTIIPVTTRTVEQYKRIKFESFNINFQWAITNNGACILHNGQPVMEWEKVIKTKIQQSERFKVVFDKYSAYKNVKGILRTKAAEGMFFYSILDKENFDVTSIKKFIEYIETVGWKYYFSGRKLYFIPEGITKERAVLFILEKMGENNFIASGDSWLDINMLNYSQRAYVPKHADIINKITNKNLYISKGHGIKATEEILNSILCV